MWLAMATSVFVAYFKGTNLCVNNPHTALDARKWHTMPRTCANRYRQEVRHGGTSVLKEVGGRPQAWAPLRVEAVS